MCTVPGLTRVCKESYNEPRALYERLKQRGMDLVTVTDHDSIDVVEELRRYPDFFLSEEVTCTMPSGTEMHAGVYGIEEKDHAELQRRRHDVESLLAYAVERRLFVTVNHLYSSLTGPRKEGDFAVFARSFHGVETVNGQMLARSNKLAEEFARRFSKPVVGGSDSHTLAGLARTFTEVPGVSNADEFVAGMRRGQSTAMGESGSCFKLTADVFAIGGSLMQAQPWIALGFGLFALAPVITLGNYVRELAFAWYWSQKNRPQDPVGVAPVVSEGVAI
jgi:predicted metal-dependent phosphoesterase TrpH